MNCTMDLRDTDESMCWYVMRDLKRANAKEPAYKQLGKEGFEVFTPMRTVLAVRQGHRIRENVPFIRDLLFVRAMRNGLDSVVEKTPTLQYRYLRGGAYRDPMTVPDSEMERFIRAVNASDSPRYYLPEEIDAKMCGRKVRIVGGAFDGYEGNLLAMRGSKVRRLLVELQGFLIVGVEVRPEYVRFL